MELGERRSTWQRDKFVMRLGCFLVTFALLASLVLEPPKARAEALTLGGTALVGAFLNACGLAPVVSGMANTQGVSDALERMVREYVLEKEPNSDAAEWLAKLAFKGFIDRKLVLEHATAAALGAFARWVAEKYGTKPGESVITPGVYPVFSDQSITFADGSTYNLSVIVNPSWNGSFMQSLDFILGTEIPFGTSQTDYTEIFLHLDIHANFIKILVQVEEIFIED